NGTRRMGRRLYGSVYLSEPFLFGKQRQFDRLEQSEIRQAFGRREQRTGRDETVRKTRRSRIYDDVAAARHTAADTGDELDQETLCKRNVPESGNAASVEIRLYRTRSIKMGSRCR